MMARRPEDTPFNQQKLTAWQPTITLSCLIAVYYVIGFCCLPLGILFLRESYDIQQYTVIYDGGDMDVNCSISEWNVGESCSLTIDFTEDAVGPLYVYYELTNFYQNHRKYVKSRSAEQLMGEDLTYDNLLIDCYPLLANGSQLLNPCGLIANSFFNDIITLNSSNNNDIVMDTDGISWTADYDVKFQQVDGFVSGVMEHFNQSCEEVLGSSSYDDCKTYEDTSDNTTYMYYYPDDSSVQYLYESFPTVVSPLEGVKNEHFINWMRTSSFPYFRKYYGKIDADMSAGDSLTFDIVLNYDVTGYDGSKALVVTNLAEIGARNNALGRTYLVVGGVCLMLGVLLTLKRCVQPRPLGDIRQLRWSAYQ